MKLTNVRITVNFFLGISIEEKKTIGNLSRKNSQPQAKTTFPIMKFQINSTFNHVHVNDIDSLYFQMQINEIVFASKAPKCGHCGSTHDIE